MWKLKQKRLFLIHFFWEKSIKMNNQELEIIQNDINEFLSMNKEKYEIYSIFHKLIISLDKDSTSIQIINYVAEHRNIFFNNQSNTILFFANIIQQSRRNFKHFETILKICVHFSKDFKEKATEDDLILICMIRYMNSVNYLFENNFFSIQTIMKLSNIHPYLFYNFLPEIEQTDPEFAEIMKKKEIISKFKTESKYNESFVNIIQLDYQKHILNRKLNYHPSLLHKSIREDDIDTFQMQLSQNNINLNDPIEFSYYERSKTMDKNIRPIKVALINGSIKICKFLLMNDAILEDNILSFAYYGHKLEIIHLIENRCSLDANTFIQPIICHRKELLDR